MYRSRKSFALIRLCFHPWIDFSSSYLILLSAFNANHLYFQFYTYIRLSKASLKLPSTASSCRSHNIFWLLVAKVFIVTFLSTYAEAFFLNIQYNGSRGPFQFLRSFYCQYLDIYLSECFFMKCNVILFLMSVQSQVFEMKCFKCICFFFFYFLFKCICSFWNYMYTSAKFG